MGIISAIPTGFDKIPLAKQKGISPNSRKGLSQDGSRTCCDSDFASNHNTQFSG
jgi:hypothetical protein